MAARVVITALEPATAPTPAPSSVRLVGAGVDAVEIGSNEGYSALRGGCSLVYHVRRLLVSILKDVRRVYDGNVDDLWLDSGGHRGQVCATTARDVASPPSRHVQSIVIGFWSQET